MYCGSLCCSVFTLGDLFHSARLHSLRQRCGRRLAPSALRSWPPARPILSVSSPLVTLDSFNLSVVQAFRLDAQYLQCSLQMTLHCCHRHLQHRGNLLRHPVPPGSAARSPSAARSGSDAIICRKRPPATGLFAAGCCRLGNAGLRKAHSRMILRPSQPPPRLVDRAMHRHPPQPMHHVVFRCKRRHCPYSSRNTSCATSSARDGS